MQGMGDLGICIRMRIGTAKAGAGAIFMQEQAHMAKRTKACMQVVGDGCAQVVRLGTDASLKLTMLWGQGITVCWGEVSEALAMIRPNGEPKGMADNGGHPACKLLLVLDGHTCLE